MFKTKFEKILMIITWFLFLLVILMSAYVLLSNLIYNKKEVVNTEKIPALKIENDKIIEEPSKEKIDNLINKINKQSIEIESVPESSEYENEIN